MAGRVNVSALDPADPAAAAASAAGAASATGAVSATADDDCREETAVTAPKAAARNGNLDIGITPQ
jgi:hypothetical protein